MTTVKSPVPRKRKSTRQNAQKRQKTDDDKPKNREIPVLSRWSDHSVSFHDFDETEADEIRSALLTWYRANRRKLPWRGDPPPYDGSTAGYDKRGDLGQSKGKKQATVSDYFAKKGKVLKEVKVEEEGEEEIGMAVTGYSVWVSEIMCQQTRVEAVIPYYLKWMKSFPTVESLALASPEAVNAHWAGLGFYRRARMLHSGANLVVSKFSGIVPSTVDELLTIDGIGRYTASAVASIAFDVSVPVVDGNVCRVLSRLKGVANHIKSPKFKDDIGWILAGQLISAGGGRHAGEVNQALMELGATWCAPSGTGVHEDDPLRKFYTSTKLGTEIQLDMIQHDGQSSKFITRMTTGETRHKCTLCDPDGISTVVSDITNRLQSATNYTTTKHTKCNKPATDISGAVIGHAAFPIPPPKKQKREEVLAVAGISSGDRWLMIRRPATGLLAGQWEFPSVCVWSSSDEQGKKSKSLTITVPEVDYSTRKLALDNFLGDLFSSQGAADRPDLRSLETNPLEHIFSHVRHTMWVEHAEIGEDASDSKSWVCLTKQEVRWMTEMDMKNVGVTSGVKKVLSSIKGKRKGSKTSKNAKRTGK